MGGGGGGPSTVTNKTELPAWLEGPVKQNISIADQIASRPYEAYGGPMTAGFTGDQTAAFDATRNAVGMSMPTFDAAINTVSPLTQFGAQNLMEYANPFINQVENNALAAVDRTRMAALNQNAQNAQRAGAFGGSRQAITDALTNAESARQAGDLSANLRMQGFNTAASLAQNAAGIRQNAANALAGLGSAQQQAAYTDAGALENIGQKQQAYQQQLLDEAYARWAEQRNYPIDMLNLRIGATSSVPGVGTQTQTRTGGASGNSFLSGLGTAASVASSIATIASL